jgi:hemolysin activation/secretion protein
MGASGTRLHLYVLSGDFEVGREFSILNIEGEGTSYGVALTRPLYKSRAKNVTLELGLDAKDAEQRLLGAITSDDKIRSVRAGVHFNTVDRKGRTVASVFVHHGLGDAIGGMEDNEPLSSRVGADGRFTKLTVEAARVRRFSAKSFLIVRASGQVTNRSLVVGEQIAIGGADSVRGYPQSEFLGDRGLQVSLEWRIAPRADKLDKLQFALFVDHGVVEVKNPVVGQNKSENITGVGFGIRANLGGDISVRADLGFSVGQNPSSGGSAIPYVQIIKRF